MKACEMCGAWSATQMVQGEEPCVECATRAAKTLSAGRRASSLGRDYDELALMVEERDADLTHLRAENTVLRDTLVKANELHEKTIAGSAENERAWAAELARLRAALAEADRERDEAARKIREHAEHVNYYGNLYSKTEVERRKLDEQREFYKDELAKAQVCADEMAALAWKWKYKADCQRETIRALVVAARAMWWALRHMGGHQPFFIGLVRSEAALLNRMGVTSEWEILERQREAERGQAGKGADNG